MDSNHSSEVDSDEQDEPETLDFLLSTARFFGRADHISAAKKPDFPLTSGDTSNYRAPSDICKRCRRVVGRISTIVATGQTFHAEHHQTYTDVKSAAESGCGICSIFFREFRLQPHQKEKSDRERETSRISAAGSSFSWELSVPWKEGDPNPDAINMENGEPEDIYCFKANIESFQAHSQSLDYDSPVPNTRDALSLCNIWLQNCRASHGVCGTPQNDSDRTSPTVERFIKVSNGELRLCLPEELEPNITYATLSHRWGLLRFTTLKQDNLNSFRERIPPDALTKTFRDAIDICRYLDIPYLWIDSLCIIQDSSEDWATQSALMAHIYGECDLNIAATSAEDGTIGCFFDRPKNWKVQIRPIPQKEDLLYDVLPCPLLNEGKDVLNQRGWVVQERYLSRRTLHFTNSEVFWECDGLSACETCPGGNPTRASPWCEYELKRRGINRSDWDNLVTRYSGANLTQSSDRLIAVEGLARTVQANTGDQYVAGMWKEWIERHLAWSPSEEFKRMANAPAPSWSWASGIGRVSLPLVWFNGTSNGPIYIELEDLQVEYSSENTFRDVESAVLRLRCTNLLRTELEPIGDAPDVYYKARFADQSFDDKLYLKIDSPDTASKAQRISAFALVVDESRGILLQPTAEEAGQYRRIGSYYAMDNSSFVKAVGAFDCIEQRELGAFSSVLEDDDDNEVYVIDLV